MRYVENSTPPDVRAPTLADARLLAHNIEVEARVVVAVGGVGFWFERVEGGNWTDREAITIARGTELDPRWLVAARAVAVEHMRAELRKLGPDEPPIDAIRCPECQHILASAELVGAGAETNIECGPVHVVVFAGGRALTFRPDGVAVWGPA